MTSVPRVADLRALHSRWLCLSSRARVRVRVRIAFTPRRACRVHELCSVTAWLNCALGSYSRARSRTPRTRPPRHTRTGLRPLRSLSLSLTHSHTHTHTLSLSLSHTLSLTHTHSLMQPFRIASICRLCTALRYVRLRLISRVECREVLYCIVE